MLKKIISGGQTGAERAALDVALMFGFPHGGWIPSGRKAEDGMVLQRYKLKEIKSGGYPNYTERNVIDSDGTLILSHGKLSGGSRLPLRLANKHDKPCLHIDLKEISTLQTVPVIRGWMVHHYIEILNVTGSRASKDPAIYNAVFDIIKGLHLTGLIKDNMPTPKDYPLPEDRSSPKPTTVDQVIDEIIEDWPLKYRVTAANLTYDGLAILELGLGKYFSEVLQNQSIGLNKELMEDCIKKSGKESLDEVEAATVIMKGLWERLKETHRLRVVK